MSSAVLPTLPGVAYPVTRSLVSDVTIQQSISGLETRINNQSVPRYKWSLSYNILRSAAAFAEFQTLLGFINSRFGQWDSFLFVDPTDNAVTGQQISVGDGSTKSFQLVRTLGGFIEPMLAPNIGATINIYLNGVIQPTGHSVSGWGTTTPGVLTFTTAPGSGVVITADFSYFSLFMDSYYELKKLPLISVKN
jgi:uncharacterized protein (TIGR02217 family)